MIVEYRGGLPRERFSPVTSGDKVIE